ncbi:uncharacterized protein LOC122056593 [Zingiber officinale]|uniref:Import inner membrane translocase subunit n=1 Tax=Zingiber officinale TaxID=94328 RepID=A0A8J5H2G2_ZINOF|nr:uncharacterized protein LOC122056593 [Zingiber officinale]XP_042474543.1 uncharacterized protein LOC122056593 [Zingiber officinale]XP_042474544.1 uncharacterized protein LOC122056593 [Zingiber officinale]KAG6518529.1 hypothetical protein ZIOFF_022005 [Zingiber officinale]
MAKPYKQMIHSFRRLYSHRFPSHPSPRSPIPCPQTRFFNATPSGYTRPSSPCLSADPLSPNRVFSAFFSSKSRLGSGTLSKLPPLGSGIKGLGLTSESRLSSRISFTRSLKYSGNAGVAAGFRKSMVDKPLSAVSSAFSRYREAVRLQMEAFWRRNYLVIVGAGAVAVCIALWRIMFGVASTFIGLSEGMAKYGFLALATAIVAFMGMYFRARFTINPDKVYRIAMRKLNTSAETLEVMGAPLAGTDVRAYVMSGGQPKLTNFKLKLGNKRCFLIFPIRGSERRGLVSVEVKKKQGQYDMKLLAVDIPMASGPDQRLFLVGDEQEYKVGGGLISELREPIVKAMAAEKEFEDLDQEEEKADEIRELQEAEQKKREEELRELEKAELERQEANRDKPQN